METGISRVKQNPVSMQLSRLSPLSPAEKQAAITKLLAKLGVRRQAKLDLEDYLVLSEDLVKFDLGDVQAGLDDIARYPRREGETAFPESARLKHAIIERKMEREAVAIRKAEAVELRYIKDHPEEFITMGELMRTTEWRGMMRKVEMVQKNT